MATTANKWVDFLFASESSVGDNTTTDFITTYDLKTQNSIWVIVDGLTRTITTDYTVNLGTKTISFVTAPALGQKITIKYIRG